MLHFNIFERLIAGFRKFWSARLRPWCWLVLTIICPFFRNATGYGHVLDEGIFGNPEGRPAEELHAAAWEIVKPHFMKGFLNHGSSTGNYIQRS